MSHITINVHTSGSTMRYVSYVAFTVEKPLCKQEGGSSLLNFGQLSTYTSSSCKDHPDEFISGLERKQEQAEGLKPQQNHRLAAPRGRLYSFLHSGLWRSSFRLLCSKTTSTFLPHWVIVLRIDIVATKNAETTGSTLTHRSRKPFSWTSLLPFGMKIMNKNRYAKDFSTRGSCKCFTIKALLVDEGLSVH